MEENENNVAKVKQLLVKRKSKNSEYAVRAKVVDDFRKVLHAI